MEATLLTLSAEMEFANRVVSAAIKATNNNAVINVGLVGSFVVLAVRSLNQQRDIEALEAQKDSLTHSNKAVKKAMWEWKQQLFAEASSTESALVPLTRLKAIYGEAVEPQIGSLSISFSFFMHRCSSILNTLFFFFLVSDSKF